MKRIFVGNLSWDAGDSDLEELFSRYGTVTNAKVITDRESGRSRGFGFVEMEDEEEAKLAINRLSDSEFMGRDLTVNEAQERERRDNRGGNRH